MGIEFAVEDGFDGHVYWLPDPVCLQFESRNMPNSTAEEDELSPSAFVHIVMGLLFPKEAVGS